MKIRLISQSTKAGKTYRYYGISLPGEILRAMKWRPGTRVVATRTIGGVVIRKEGQVKDDER